MKTWVRLNSNGRTGLLTSAVVAAVAVVVALPSTPALAQDTKLPAAEDIIEKSIAAMGGREAFEKIHNRVSKGTFEIVGQGLMGAMTTYEAAPNKQYVRIELKDIGTMESGTDGTVHWESNAMIGPRVLEGPEQALNARLTRFNAALHWKELYQNVECVGVEDVDERPCYKVVFTPAEGEPETAYYDRKSYMPRKTVLMAQTPMGAIPLEVVTTNYRPVDGVQLPFKVTQTVASLQQMIMIVESVEHNTEIPADRFALPAAVRALVGQNEPAKEKTGGAKPQEP